MKILSIGAHPDDIEYSCYGFLQKMKKAGHEIYLLVMSGGECGTDPLMYNRETEQNNAFQKSGFSGIFIKKYKDGEIPCNSKVISDIENVMKNVEPDLILTHYTEDYHQDHRAVAMATIAAARNRKALLFYQSYSAINFVPQIYVNIEEEIQDKKEILNCFTSQLRKNDKKGIDFIECAIATNRHYGVFSNANYAEGFCVYKIVM